MKVKTMMAGAAIVIFMVVGIVSVQAAEEGVISLTLADGTGLEMTELKVSTVVDGITAFTEVEMMFYNPENRQREGRFCMLLPELASVSRFAMKMDKYWQEGEIVETRKARRVYEDFLHRRQDPALLEQDSGNFFTARVFPIPAHAEKKLIISYSELLVNNHSTYTFPLKGLPKLGNLRIKAFFKSEAQESANIVSSFAAEVKDWKVIDIKKEGYKPDEDFVLRCPFAQKDSYALRAGRLCAVKFKPVVRAEKTEDENIRDWIVLFDSSASQALGYKEHVKRLARILNGLIRGKQAQRIMVFSFDQDLALAGTVTAVEDIETIETELTQRLALGASDFGKAFSQLADHIKTQNTRLLIVSDAVATAGETDAKVLSEMLGKIPAIKRVDCLALSAYRDAACLKALTLAAENPGQVLDGKMEDKLLNEKLSRKTIKSTVINVPDAQWFWPREVAGLQPDDEVIVFAEVEEGRPFEIECNGKKISLALEKTEPLLLKREWVKARLQKLLSEEQNAADKDMRSAFHNEIIRLSENERVLCPYTALLVLETEADYKRYNIDRRALADILTIGPGGIEVIERKGIEPVVPPPMPIAIDRKGEGQPEDKTIVERVINTLDELKEFSSAAMKSKSLVGADAAPEGNVNFRQRETAGEVDSSTLFRAGNVESGDRDMRGDAEREEMSFSNGLPAAAVPEKQRRAAEPQLPRPEIADIAVTSSSVEKPAAAAVWSGNYEKARNLILNSSLKEAREFVRQWYEKSPGDAAALIALGEVEAKAGDYPAAARAYGSLIDLFPSRADIRRWAAGRLLEINSGLSLAIDCLEKARIQRPEHPSVYHLLACAYVANAELEKAVNVLSEALKQNFPDRYAQAGRILSEDIGIILSCVQAQPLLKLDIVQQLVRTQRLDTTMKPQLRCVLTWETDANDVDFHIYDGKNNHAYYSQKTLPTGGELYADITQGYGPECFVVENPKAYPYRFQAHYYSRGPMGYGMGLLQVIRLSAEGKLSIDNRPFIIMRDSAFVDMGIAQE